MASDGATIARPTKKFPLGSGQIRQQPGDAGAHLQAAADHLLQAGQDVQGGTLDRDIEQAVRYVSNAVQLGGKNPTIIFDAACELMTQSCHDVAATGFRLTIRVDSAHAEAHARLGIACRAMGDLTAAETSYRSAISLDPQAPEPLVNLGNVFRERGEYQKSLECADRAIQVSPSFAPAHNLRGLALDDCRESLAAEDSYLHAIRLDPTSADYLNNLALHYNQAEEYQLAEELFALALQLAPESAAIHNNVGKCFKDQEKLAESAEHYQRVATLVPGQPLLALRAETLWPTVFPDRDSMTAAQSRLFSVARRLTAEAGRNALTDLINCAEIPPFGLQFVEGNVRAAKEAYAGIFAGKVSPDVSMLPRRKLPQVVIVVTRNHEGIFLRSLRGVLDHLPLAGYQITVVTSRNGAARVRKEIGNEAVAVVPLPDRAERVLDTISELRPDVLYYWEIGTDMLNYFLPFYRLAPVQMTSWGVQVTSGIPSVDYYLSSELVEPGNATDHYSEHLLLADTLLTYQFPQESIPQDEQRSRRQSKGRSYVMAQNGGKLHPDFDSIVIEILRGDPEGVFVSTADPVAAEGEAYLARIIAQAPDLAERIRLLGRLPRLEYLSLIDSADVLLDPLHFGGVNSTYDGLSLAKPIVTCPSSYHRGRYTAACLRRLGVNECITTNTNDYVAQAHRLANDLEFRRDVSARITAARNELFQDQRAVAAHEEVFQQLIEVARRTSIGKP